MMTPHLYLAVRVTVASSSKASSSRRAAPRPRLKVPVKVPGRGTPGTDVCVSTSRRPSPPRVPDRAPWRAPRARSRARVASGTATRASRTTTPLPARRTLTWTRSSNLASRSLFDCPTSRCGAPTPAGFPRPPPPPPPPSAFGAAAAATVAAASAAPNILLAGLGASRAGGASWGAVTLESLRASPDTSESASTSFHGSAASAPSSFLSPRATSLARARQRSKAAAPTMHARGWDVVESVARPARTAVKVWPRARGRLGLGEGKDKPRCDMSTVSYDLLVRPYTGRTGVPPHTDEYKITHSRGESHSQCFGQLERRDDGAPRPRRGRRRGSRRERRTPCLASGSCALRRGTSRSRS